MAVQVEAGRILRVYRVRDSRGESIETRLQRGDLLVAQLNIAGKIAAGDRRSYVSHLREHILKSRRGIGLRCEVEALIPHNQRRASRRGQRQAGSIGLDRLHVNQLRELCHAIGSKRVRLSETASRAVPRCASETPEASTPSASIQSRGRRASRSAPRDLVPGLLRATRFPENACPFSIALVPVPTVQKRQTALPQSRPPPYQVRPRVP